MRNCNCLGTSHNPVDPLPDHSDCICGTNKFVHPDDGPDPCSDSYSYDISEMFEMEACGGNFHYEIQSFEGFLNPSITGGVLSATTNGTGGKLHQVTIKSSCDDSNLSVFATLTVGFRDLCKGVDCDGYEECDPCTGICGPVDVDIES